MPGGTCLCVNQRNSVEWSPSAVNIGYLRDRDREGLDNNFSGAYIYLPIYVYIFWPHCMACGILVSWPGIEPVPCQWKRQVLTTALPGNSLMCIHLCSVILFVLVSLHCYCNLKVIRNCVIRSFSFYATFLSPLPFLESTINTYYTPMFKMNKKDTITKSTLKS